MITIVETRVFRSRVPDLWTEEEYDTFIAYISSHPRAGVLIPGTGGLRKLRWTSKGSGKRSGSRVIYLLSHNRGLWLLTLYGKSQKENIPSHELRLIGEMINGYQDE